MCTGIRLKAENGAVVFGRTLEFGQTLESGILMIPRNFLFVGTALDNNPGLSWKSKYACVGANMFGLHQLVDGVNEKGLAAGLFYFPGYANYTKVTPEQYQNCIAPWQLVSWVLSTCASVAEVKALLPNVIVCATVFEKLGEAPPVHLVVHDASGYSVVAEYVDGTLHLYDNPLGVVTNSPTFDWHLTNLNNYVNLFPLNHPPVKLGSVTLSPPGQGSGGFGLPGDFTPPSRFVRAVFFSQTVKAGKTAHEARDTVFHLLNLFDIPIGTVGHAEPNGMVEYDHTQWTSVSDLTHKKYYWRTYENFQIYGVDLEKMDLDSLVPITITMNYPEQIIDVTPFEKARSVNVLALCLCLILVTTGIRALYKKRSKSV